MPRLDKAFAIADTDHVLTYGTTIKQDRKSPACAPVAAPA